MRTEAESSSGVRKKKKRSSERSSERSQHRDVPADDGGWKQYTSPDGHPYYYNAATKESRWEPPPSSRKPKSRAKDSSSRRIQEETPLNETSGAVEESKKKREPRNAMFQKLQASLEGRLGAMNGMPMMGRPPMVTVVREDPSAETTTQAVDEYEEETAGMSAAERLRFLRKKRQQDMLNKRTSIAEDDFMAEVANNMKKKEATRESHTQKKTQMWKEQEAEKEERKRQQMQQEMEAKEEEPEKQEREKQAAIEREQQREKERAEQLALEQQRELERKQRQEEADRRLHDKEEKKKRALEKADLAEAADLENENDDDEEAGILEHLPRDETAAEVASPFHGWLSRSRGSSKHESLTLGTEASELEVESPVNNALGSTVVSDAGESSAQDERKRAKEERRTRKQREKELAEQQREQELMVGAVEASRNSMSSDRGQGEESSTQSASSAEAEGETRAREKQLRRERRRMAKMEAALAAQNLHGSTQQNGESPIAGLSQNPEHQAQSAPEQAIPRAASHHGYAAVPGSGHPLPGNPPISGGIYTPYPYMMIPPPPPPPSPYGYYYPYMQPPPVMPMPMYPPGMSAVPAGYQLMHQQPSPSSNGMAMPSAMVPFSGDPMAFGAGGMFGQQAAPELSRCECCQGIGVGLVEKNGVCAHCNRLRLAFIVDSAQMRQRCSVCGGWGFRLLQANGMCEHCTRQTAQKAQMKAVADARRRNSVATGALHAAVATPSSTPVRRFSTGNSRKKDELGDIEWDKSSSDEDSDWDD